MTFLLAACAEIIYLELPFVERVLPITDQGFELEIWDWTDKDLDALTATGATFSSMKGYLRGGLTTREGADELVSTAREALIVAKILDVPRLVMYRASYCMAPDSEKADYLSNRRTSSPAPTG